MPGNLGRRSGHGALDALVAGVIGIMIGAALYAAVYPKLERNVLHIGEFGDKTLIDVLRIDNAWLVILPVAALMIGFLFILESLGW